jgi:hypothetical protein
VSQPITAHSHSLDSTGPKLTESNGRLFLPLIRIENPPSFPLSLLAAKSAAHGPPVPNAVAAHAGTFADRRFPGLAFVGLLGVARDHQTNGEPEQGKEEDEGDEEVHYRECLIWCGKVR